MFQDSEHFFFLKKKEYPVLEKLVFATKISLSHIRMNFAVEKAVSIYFKTLKTIS